MPLARSRRWGTIPGAMRRVALALCVPLVLVFAGVANAQEDPLETPACREALDAVRAQEAAASAAREADAQRRSAALAQLKAARQKAAQTCLRSRADRAPPQGRMAQPPVSVPPSALPPPAPRVTATPPSAAPPPAAPLLSITSCDQAGCWASDGSRLQRAGPNALLGPRGICTTSGTVLVCP
jgi:hypothetical protein